MLDGKNWRLLDGAEAGGALPAIADYATIRWSLGLSVGDTLVFLDEKKKPFRVRIAGAVSGSILQGDILISEERFIEKFPSQAGYRRFLIDVAKERAEEVGDTLEKAFWDDGLELTPTLLRLSRLHSVENAYISIFQLLGGLGLILGCAGLGVVAARNVPGATGRIRVAGSARVRAKAIEAADFS